MHVGLKRLSRPRCFEDTFEKNITDDQNPGKCGINRKRTDSNWGKVDYNFTHWGTPHNHYFICSTSAHGGLTLCEDGNRLIPNAELFHFSETVDTYGYASKVCSNTYKGRLFDDIRGDRFPLSYVSDGLKTCMTSNSIKMFFVDGSDQLKEGEWRDSQGQIVTSDINWNTKNIVQPDGNSKENFLAVECYDGPNDTECVFFDVADFIFACYACISEGDLIF